MWQLNEFRRGRVWRNLGLPPLEPASGGGAPRFWQGAPMCAPGLITGARNARNRHCSTTGPRRVQRRCLRCGCGAGACNQHWRRTAAAVGHHQARLHVAVPCSGRGRSRCPPTTPPRARWTRSHTSPWTLGTRAVRICSDGCAVEGALRRGKSPTCPACQGVPRLSCCQPVGATNCHSYCQPVAHQLGANLLHTSCQAVAGLPCCCQPVANLLPTCCQPVAALLPTGGLLPSPCRPVANLSPDYCQPAACCQAIANPPLPSSIANLSPTCCQHVANLLPTCWQPDPCCQQPTVAKFTC